MSKEEIISRVKNMLIGNMGWNKKDGAGLRCKHISEGNIRAWAKKTSEEKSDIFLRAHLTMIKKGVRYLPKKRPNKPERRLQGILNRLFPNEWEYTGDGRVWIGRYNPDFINVNGKKQLIEMFGIYWHNDSEAQKKITYFKNWGYDTLVIWENELEASDLEKRIVDFVDHVGLKRN